jgi:hypothetical protein
LSLDISHLSLEGIGPTSRKQMTNEKCPMTNDK